MNEIVPNSMRGGLVELHSIFFILGYAIAAWVGFGFLFWKKGGVDNTWRPPLALQSGFALLTLIALIWVPESPRWLILQGRVEEAERILTRLHSDPRDPDKAYAKAELYQIKKQIVIDRTLGNSWLDIIRKPSYRKRALIGMATCGFIQSSGDLVINSAYLLSSPAAFADSSRLRAHALSTAGVLSCQTAVVSSCLADVYARRVRHCDASD